MAEQTLEVDEQFVTDMGTDLVIIPAALWDAVKAVASDEQIELIKSWAAAWNEDREPMLVPVQIDVPESFPDDQ